MELENYFDKLAADDIRLKGTRIGIEHILYQYIHRGQTPEAIFVLFAEPRGDRCLSEQWVGLEPPDGGGTTEKSPSIYREATDF